MKKLKELGFDVLPVMSSNAVTTDTRFGKCDEIRKNVELIEVKTNKEANLDSNK